MIYRKKHVIAACFSMALSAFSYAEAPVVDDSDNYAILDEQSSAVRPNFDQPQIEDIELDNPRNEKYLSETQQDDGPALAQDDAVQSNKAARNSVDDSAALIDRVQTLQKELQELRGEMEVQAHELKTLQQQQLSFYKDLDARITNGSTAKAATNIIPDTPVSPKVQTAQKPTSNAATKNKVVAAVAPVSANPVSKTNPADEQISYMAAYELVKEKRYEDAIKSMQNFVAKYPRGGYTANAQYWLGELFMTQKNYSKAIEHFEIVLQQFPSSSKSAASLLKDGYAYAAQGNTAEAKKRLQQVIKIYPGTQTAQLASLKLEAISTL